MDFIIDKIAQRLGGKKFYESEETYRFSEIKRTKKEILSKYPYIPLIDMGIGEPDLPADSIIVDTLCKVAGKPENRWYADNGIPEFQEACAKFLKEVFGLSDIDPYSEIRHGIGAKSILSILPLCFINPGDITLTTTPGYPVLATHTKYLGGEVYDLPLYKENNYFPDLSNIPENILQRAKLLYINYPNNPTGQIPTKEFYKEVVDFAHKNNIIVIADAAYSTIIYDNIKPLSFLSIDGAKDIGVEVHSLSKAFNMTGWRLGFIVGNPKIIELYSNVKSNIDSGQFIGIQKAGITALNHPELIQKNCRRYSRRLDLLVEALKEVGFKAEKPKGTFYCYVPIPKGTKTGIIFTNAREVSKFLLKKALISTVPWDSAGPHLRFSVTFEAKDYNEEIKIIEQLKNRLLKLKLIF
ncbi:LL-diaminopimelate aminotransferase [Thermohalobacter berrensis]|uniref:Aminotransferase n=1 Tax=Thermohalobacter berrensis TaxID=99594 RepID=A0A419SWI9_9FIRM|nr:LL-diaminopimelate aminotransferase [Thermohalobacter berrensis]RKD29575.1 aspartate aminotransferase [Thermohalobacter berrensis]